MDDQVFNILMNTAAEDFPEQMDSANDKFQQYLVEEMHRGENEGEGDVGIPD